MASPTPLQKLAVALAFIAAALSFAVVALSLRRGTGIAVTPLFGGIVMLVFAFSGLQRLRRGGQS